MKAIAAIHAENNETSSSNRGYRNRQVGTEETKSTELDNGIRFGNETRLTQGLDS